MDSKSLGIDIISTNASHAPKFHSGAFCYEDKGWCYEDEGFRIPISPASQIVIHHVIGNSYYFFFSLMSRVMLIELASKPAGHATAKMLMINRTKRN